MTTQERADFWQQQITAWLDSGLSAATPFAKARHWGLSPVCLLAQKA
ncbi:hypothetical protein [Aeromonas caviae]|nr:hypothetical protein [Aeromonas caviae]